MASDDMIFNMLKNDASETSKKLSSRIFNWVFLKYFLLFLSVFLFSSGTVILFLRISGIATFFSAFRLSFYTAFVAALCSYLYSKRFIPHPMQIEALIDLKNNCHGLFICREKLGLTDWNSLKLPEVSFSAGKPVSLLLCAVLFFSGSYLLPAGNDDQTKKKIDISVMTDDLSEQLEILEESVSSDTDEITDLRNEIRQIIEMSASASAGETFEAVDHLREKLNQALTDQTVENLNQLEKVESMSRLLEKYLKDSQFQGLNDSELSELLEMLEETGLLSDASSTDDMQKMEKMSPEEAREMLEKLKNNKEEIMKKLKQMQEKGNSVSGARKLLDISQLVKNASKGSQSGKEPENMYGSGGNDKGEGHAFLNYGFGTPADDRDFKQTALPPGALAGLEDSVLLSRGQQQGTENVTEHDTGTGKQFIRDSGQGFGRKNKVLPCHRQAVSGYFSRSRNE